MPRRPRKSSAPTIFHVGNRGVRRQALFARASDYRAFVNILREGLNKFPVRLIAYCLMPNHWHVLLGPEDPAIVSKLMHWVTTTHSIRWHRHRQSTGMGPVYQNRSWSAPMKDDVNLVHVCRHIERNALKARLVTRAEDWPWSSLSERVWPTGCLPVVRPRFLYSRAWVDYVNTPQVVHDLVNAVTTRRPPSLDAPEEPGVGEEAEQVGHVAGGAHKDQTDAHVEGAQHFVVGDLAGALQPREQRRHRPTGSIERKRPAGGRAQARQCRRR